MMPMKSLTHVPLKTWKELQILLMNIGIFPKTIYYLVQVLQKVDICTTLKMKKFMSLAQ